MTKNDFCLYLDRMAINLLDSRATDIYAHEVCEQIIEKTKEFKKTIPVKEPCEYHEHDPHMFTCKKGKIKCIHCGEYY